MSAAHCSSPRALAALAACALMALACTEPTFVSLGRNTQNVASADPDPELASAPLGPDPEYGLVADPEPTATLESCASSPDGCEHPPEPTSCTLGNAAITIGTACDTRRPVACPSDLASDGDRVKRLLSDVLAECTERGHYLTVTFSAGCADAFSLDPLDAPGAEGASACLAARFAAERYPCAESIACAVGSTFAIIAR